MFGTCECCGDQTAAVRLWSTRWGFAPFHAGFDTVYTVGSGFSATAMTAGMLCKRVAAGVVTGVYEAKGTFTASGDPETDTTNWAHAGLTAPDALIAATYTVGLGWSGSISPGQVGRRISGGVVTGIYECIKYSLSPGDPATDTVNFRPYWWNCEPILKYTVAAKFTVGTGWGSAATLGFGGNRADETLNFAVGALVARDDGGSLTFWRCKAAVDRSGDPTAGDPASDTTHWEAYAGRRSLWLDFTAAPNAGFSAPFNSHCTPTKRYSRWRETTEVFLDNVSQGTKVREFTRDNMGGLIATNSDQWVATFDLAMETISPGPEPPGSGWAFPPPGTPGLNDDYWTSYHYHKQKVESITLTGAVYPDFEMRYSYTMKSYSGHPYMPPENWPALPFAEGVSTVSGSLALTGLSLTPTETRFEWTGHSVPIWHEFDVAAYAQYWYDEGHDPAVFWACGSVIGQYGEGTDPGGAIIVPYNIPAGINTITSRALKVVQTIQVLDEITHVDHVAECIGLLPAFPSFGFFKDCGVNKAGHVVEGAPVIGKFLEVWCNLCLNTAASFGGMTDARLGENSVFLMKLAADMRTAPHWTLEQTQGFPVVETEYLASGTHSFSPMDATLKAAKVTVSDPSP